MGEASESPSGQELLRSVLDGLPLKVLAGGLVIVRRKKHEPIDLAGLTAEKIVERTSKRSGSKFTARWDLMRYANWIEARTGELHWTAKTGPVAMDTPFDEVVGISRGKEVYTIRLVSDGRHLHAYPVE
ncbi:MAG: hypothetical protein ABSB42_18695 [Tepidisphaeraceae bacterium]|jgi:hypothetical protein